MNGFTVGERRGLIVILAILTGILLVTCFFSDRLWRSDNDEIETVPDSTVESMQNEIKAYPDTSTVGENKKKRKRKTQKIKNKNKTQTQTQTQKPRIPLSEPLPLR